MFTCHIKSVSSPTTPASQNTLLSPPLYSQGLPLVPHTASQLHFLPSKFLPQPKPTSFWDRLGPGNLCYSTYIWTNVSSSNKTERYSKGLKITASIRSWGKLWTTGYKKAKKKKKPQLPLLKSQEQKQDIGSKRRVLCFCPLHSTPPKESANYLSNSSILSWCLGPQSCPTLCYPMDCSQPDSSDHGILQARILEWVTLPFSRGWSYSHSI